MLERDTPTAVASTTAALPTIFRVIRHVRPRTTGQHGGRLHGQSSAFDSLVLLPANLKPSMHRRDRFETGHRWRLPTWERRRMPIRPVSGAHQLHRCATLERLSFACPPSHLRVVSVDLIHFPILLRGRRRDVTRDASGREGLRQDADQISHTNHRTEEERKGMGVGGNDVVVGMVSLARRWEGSFHVVNF